MNLTTFSTYLLSLKLLSNTNLFFSANFDKKQQSFDKKQQRANEVWWETVSDYTTPYWIAG